jgi:hypothetical protein
MNTETSDRRYAAVVQALGHLRGALKDLLAGSPVDVKAAYDATSWPHIQKVYGIKESDLAIDINELRRDAIEQWHEAYPWSGDKVTIEKK